MPITPISVPGAPRAIGPYSQAVRAGPFLFCSGQIALDPATGNLVGETAREQTARVMENLQAVIEGAGGSLAQVVKTTIYLTDLNDFAEVGEVYARFFPKQPPARATVGVSELPKGAHVEIEAVCWMGE